MSNKRTDNLAKFLSIVSWNIETVHWFNEGISFKKIISFYSIDYAHEYEFNLFMETNSSIIVIYIIYCWIFFKGACSKIFGKWIFFKFADYLLLNILYRCMFQNLWKMNFIKFTDKVTFHTNISYMVKQFCK